MDRSAVVTKTFATLERASVQLVSLLDESKQQETLSNSTNLKVKIGKIITSLQLPDVNLHITHKDEDMNETLRYVYWTLEPKVVQHLFPEIRYANTAVLAFWLFTKCVL